MKFASYKILFFLAIFLGVLGCERSHLNDPVLNGIIDLQNHQINQALSLNGSWEFYWNSMAVQEFPEYIDVPGSWFDNGNLPRPGEGFATYRLLILNPPPHLSIYTRHAHSAYVMSANGHKVASNGNVGVDAQSTYAEFKPLIAPLGEYGDSLEIQIQVSNFTHRSGGLANELLIGPPELLQNMHTKNLIYDAIIIVAMIIFGLYHLLLYAFQRARTALYFAGCCFLFAVRVAATGSLLLKSLWPSLGAELLLRFEYASVFGVALFFLYEMNLFPRIVRHRPAVVFLWANLLLLILTLILPAPTFTYTAHLWQASVIVGILIFSYSCYGAIRGRLPKARLFTVGFILCSIFGINDVLNGAGIIQTFSSLPTVVTILLVLQSLILSRDFAGASKEVSQMSSKLEAQKAHERGLRRIQLQMQGVLDKIEVSAVTVDDMGFIVYGNRAFYDAYGSADHLQKLRIHEILPVVPLGATVFGAKGEGVTRSELEMGEETLQLYVSKFPENPTVIGNADDLVAHLHHNRQRLQKLSSILAQTENGAFANELIQIDAALSHASKMIGKNQGPSKVELGIDLLQETIAYWQILTGKTKYDLARESGLWSVSVNLDGWERTRTLDRYLSQETLPNYPRWGTVVKTAEFVLCYSGKSLPQRALLTEKMIFFSKISE